MSALGERDDLLRQASAARAAHERFGRELAMLREEISRAENEERAAYADAPRGLGPEPEEIAARVKALREKLPAAQDAFDGADRARTAVDRELRALYRRESEAFAEEAEAATQRFVARRDEVIGDLRGVLADLVRLDRLAADLWRPLCAAVEVEGPRRSAAWTINAQLGELAAAVPRSRAFTPEGEEAPTPEPVSDEPVWLKRDDGAEFCEVPGSPAYVHLVENRGAVPMDPPEVTA